VRHRPAFGKTLGGVAAIVATAAVATSIWLNPPSEARDRRLDQVRMQRLYQTENAVQTYYTSHHTLPADLQTLASANTHHRELNWHDPKTDQPFEYAVAGETTYRLCAIFARSSAPGDPFIGFDPTHAAGRDCFQKTVTNKESPGDF